MRWVGLIYFISIFIALSFTDEEDANKSDPHSKYDLSFSSFPNQRYQDTSPVLQSVFHTSKRNILLNPSPVDDDEEYSPVPCNLFINHRQEIEENSNLQKNISSGSPRRDFYFRKSKEAISPTLQRKRQGTPPWLPNFKFGRRNTVGHISNRNRNKSQEEINRWRKGSHNRRVLRSTTGDAAFMSFVENEECPAAQYMKPYLSRDNAMTTAESLHEDNDRLGGSGFEEMLEEYRRYCQSMDNDPYHQEDYENIGTIQDDIAMDCQGLSGEEYISSNEVRYPPTEKVQRNDTFHGHSSCNRSTIEPSEGQEVENRNQVQAQPDDDFTDNLRENVAKVFDKANKTKSQSIKSTEKFSGVQAGLNDTRVPANGYGTDDVEICQVANGGNESYSRYNRNRFVLPKCAGDSLVINAEPHRTRGSSGGLILSQDEVIPGLDSAGVKNFRTPIVTEINAGDEKKGKKPMFESKDSQSDSFPWFVNTDDDLPAVSSDNKIDSQQGAWNIIEILSGSKETHQAHDKAAEHDTKYTDTVDLLGSTELNEVHIGENIEQLDVAKEHQLSQQSKTKSESLRSHGESLQHESDELVSTTLPSRINTTQESACVKNTESEEPTSTIEFSGSKNRVPDGDVKEDSGSLQSNDSHSHSLPTISSREGQNIHSTYGYDSVKGELQCAQVQKEALSPTSNNLKHGEDTEEANTVTDVIAGNLISLKSPKTPGTSALAIPTGVDLESNTLHAKSTCDVALSPIQCLTCDVSTQTCALTPVTSKDRGIQVSAEACLLATSAHCSEALVYNELDQSTKRYPVVRLGDCMSTNALDKCKRPKYVLPISSSQPSEEPTSKRHSRRSKKWKQERKR